MPVFEYTALDNRGKTTSGIIDAEGAQAARQKLRTSGIFPVTIKETQETAPKKEHKGFSLSRRFTRIKSAEVAMMTRQLATLIGAGFPLVSAIDALIPQTKSHGFKRILAQIKDSIVEGNSFAGALSLYPNIFSPLYINMVRAGESSGTLEIILTRLAEVVTDLLKLQIRAGADVVQLFDTWAGYLSPEDYQALSLPYTQMIVENLKETGVPVILYLRNAAGHLEAAAGSGCEVLSIDSSLRLADARRLSSGFPDSSTAHADESRILKRNFRRSPQPVARPRLARLPD